MINHIYQTVARPTQILFADYRATTANLVLCAFLYVFFLPIIGDVIIFIFLQGAMAFVTYHSPYYIDRCLKSAQLKRYPNILNIQGNLYVP